MAAAINKYLNLAIWHNLQSCIIGMEFSCLEMKKIIFRICNIGKFNMIYIIYIGLGSIN